MPEEPRPPRRRPRGGRRRGPQRSPQQGQAPVHGERAERPRPERPTEPRDRPAPRDRAAPRGDRRAAPRDDRRLARRDDQPPAAREERGPRGRSRRGGRGRRESRGPLDVRPGTPAVILLDAREGEPDRTGSPAVFEGFFDFETGEPRRPGSGIPRLRVGDERLWGFECWWRVDAEKTGLTDADAVEVETSKKLLRGLLRDARRSPRMIR